MIRLWQAFGDWMRAHIAPSLKATLAPLDAWINTLPSWMGTVCAVGLFVVAGLVLSTLSRSYIYLGAPDQARWRDLRIWTWLVLLPYIIIYIVF
ncbi:MAG: hypothetical protein JXQ73_18590 [Phycisphaerae bacterium]|nr:hypothetical protein [Phycisphaerae bacterium]